MTSLRDAINAMCKSCIYDPGSGNGGWREQVADCSSGNCPLHPIRPQSAAKSGRGAALSLRDRQRPIGAVGAALIACKKRQIDCLV